VSVHQGQRGERAVRELVHLVVQGQQRRARSVPPCFSTVARITARVQPASLTPPALAFSRNVLGYVTPWNPRGTGLVEK
jgi:hypothetical protein